MVCSNTCGWICNRKIYKNPKGYSYEKEKCRIHFYIFKTRGMVKSSYLWFFTEHIKKSATTYIDYGFTEKLAIKIFIRSEQLS